MTGTDEAFTGFVDSALLHKDGVHGYVLVLGGWLLARDSRTQELLITLPSGIGVYAQLGERPDVAARIPQIPHAKHAGFTVSLPVQEIEDQYILEFRARLESGQQIMSQLHIKPEAAFQRTSLHSSSDDLHTSPIVSRSHSPFGNIDQREAYIHSLSVKLKSFLRSKTTWSFIPDPPTSISVVIPVANHAELTFGCLEALRAQMIRDLEIIVVDNGSSDDTSELLSRMRGVVVIRNQTNLPFGDACNAGANASSAPFILFLNNDAFVLPGALESLMTALVANPKAGAVGGKLIRPDGRVQEAGAFILPDGTTVGRARGTQPDSRIATYQLQVDYCSAAFLLIRKDSFQTIGGFDSRFNPAYYEDVDLCVRLARLEQVCLVEPRAEAVHIERGSAHTIQESNTALQKNRELFRKLHPSLPKLRSGKKSIVATEKDTPKVLVIDDRLPDATVGQGQGRAAQIIAGLITAQLRIYFYAAHDQNQLATLEQPAGITLVKPKPFEGELSFLRRMMQEVDSVFVSRPHHMEQVQVALRLMPPIAAAPRIVYDAEAIQSKREILRFEILQNETLSDDEIIEVVCNEISVARDADVILASSQLEAAAFTDFGFSPPIIVSHGISVPSSTTPFSARSNILTVGPLLNEETPNSDGLLWFITEVFPHIKNLLGEKSPSIHSVGTCQVPKITELQSRDFRLMGKISNLSTTYERHRVFIAPTRFAAGIPIKVIEAAAHGVPCVVSPVLAAQLGWNDEEEVLVGYNAADFGAKCAALYVNENLWSDLRERALARVTRQFSLEQFQSSLTDVIALLSPSTCIPS